MLKKYFEGRKAIRQNRQLINFLVELTRLQRKDAGELQQIFAEQFVKETKDNEKQERERAIQAAIIEKETGEAPITEEILPDSLEKEIKSLHLTEEEAELYKALKGDKTELTKNGDDYNFRVDSALLRKKVLQRLPYAVRKELRNAMVSRMVREAMEAQKQPMSNREAIALINAVGVRRYQKALESSREAEKMGTQILRDRFRRELEKEDIFTPEEKAMHSKIDSVKVTLVMIALCLALAGIIALFVFAAINGPIWH